MEGWTEHSPSLSLCIVAFILVTSPDNKQKLPALAPFVSLFCEIAPDLVVHALSSVVVLPSLRLPLPK